VVLVAAIALAAAAAGTAGDDWPYPMGDLANTDYSPLTQIDTGNVSRLHRVWQVSFDGPAYSAPVEGAPIVVAGAGKNLPLESGTMFLSTRRGAVALDPATGRTIWSYSGPAPGNGAASLVSGWSARMQAYGRGLLFAGRQDGSIVALNGKTGAPVWTAAVSAAGSFAGHAGYTSPWTIFYDDGRDGLVFSAPNNGDSPLRGHLDAYDAKTGVLVWRWWTTPDPKQVPYILTWSNPAEAAVGGAAVWSGVAIDPGLGRLYTATGNPYPYTGRQPGKDLWSDSIVSLDLHTGALRWYFQLVHHDIWDFDCSTPPVLFDLRRGGRSVPALAGSCKTGYVYELDRRNGHPIFPIPEVRVPDLSHGRGAALNNTWPTQPEPQGGAAKLLIHCPTAAQARAAIPGFPRAPNGTPILRTCPFAPPFNDAYLLWGPFWELGGTNYPRMSFDPQTGELYVCANVTMFATENVSPADYHLQTIATGSVASGGWTGSVSALNMTTNRLDWQVRYDARNDGACYSGVLSTAGGLVFVASKGVSTAPVPVLAGRGVAYGGTLYAYDARTGNELWAYRNVDQIQAPPVTYAVNGRQYVVEYLEGKGPRTPGSVGRRDLLTAFAL
jgi:glucose dehydrogenase